MILFGGIIGIIGSVCLPDSISDSGSLEELYQCLVLPILTYACCYDITIE